jgi:hypothetical protein
MDKLKLYVILSLLLLVSLVNASSGLDQFDSFTNYMNITQPNQTYQFKMITDDIGSNTNRGSFANLDGDSEMEYLQAEYGGRLMIWDWEDWKQGKRTAQSNTDLGTHHLCSADGDFVTGKNIGVDCIDNDGDGYCELVSNNYDGLVRVSEYNYDTKVISNIWSQPADIGNYRSSATWCDIDGDGKYEIFTCEYSAELCYLYNYTDATTYTLIDTVDPVGGTVSHYSNNPLCADIDNDGDMDLLTASSNGYLNWFNWTSPTLTNIWTSADLGSFYSGAVIGDFNGDGTNYVHQLDTSGYAYLYNCSSTTSCIQLDKSNDIGSTAYGSGFPLVRQFNGKDVVFSAETSDRPFISQFDGENLTLTNFGQRSTASYTQIGVPNISTTNNYEYVIHNGRYSASVFTSKWNSGNLWNPISYDDQLERQHYPPESYNNGFLYCGGWQCGQFDTSTPEDECIIFTYEGLGFMYTLQNITEFKVDTITENEVAMLDIMPKDAIQYLPDGENRTYCVNENKNMFRDSVAGTEITAWANAIDDDGTAISNSNVLTDNEITTYTVPYHQNTADRIAFDSGANQGMRLNLSKETQLGTIRVWGWYADEYDPINLTVEISDTPCTNPDTNSYTTLFDEKNGNDISGTWSIKGLTLRFTPQNVQCIRINASGANYAHTATTGNNFIVEIRGYYANNCTFYYTPMGELNANIHEEYNISQRIDTLNSPRFWDSDIISPIKDWTANILTVIDQTILWLKRN